MHVTGQDFWPRLYKGTDLEVINGGLLFTTQMSLNRMVNNLALKGKKAMVSVLLSLFPFRNCPKLHF